MSPLKLILLVFALVIEAFVALFPSIPTDYKIRLIAAGLAFWLAALVLP
jgi:hypothetical protein